MINAVISFSLENANQKLRMKRFDKLKTSVIERLLGYLFVRKFFDFLFCFFIAWFVFKDIEIVLS